MSKIGKIKERKRSVQKTQEENLVINTHTSSASDIREAKSRLLIAIYDVVRFGFAFRSVIALLNLRRRHSYLILCFPMLFHVTNGARHKSIGRNMYCIKNQIYKK